MDLRHMENQIIVPILKPGKHAGDLNSLKLIVLSSTLFKLFEHLIKTRLEWIVESRSCEKPLTKTK